jgi:hypothetical protein
MGRVLQSGVVPSAAKPLIAYFLPSPEKALISSPKVIRRSGTKASTCEVPPPHEARVHARVKVAKVTPTVRLAEDKMAMRDRRLMGVQMLQVAGADGSVVARGGLASRE